MRATAQDDITSIVPLYDATCSHYTPFRLVRTERLLKASNFVPRYGTYESTALVSNNDVSLSDVPMPPLLLYSVLYYTDEWSRLYKSFKIFRTADGPAASNEWSRRLKSFKILRTAEALPLLVCFVAAAEVLHLMKALYCFRRRPSLLLLLYSVLYYTDERSRRHKSFKILKTADGPAATSLSCC
eukprot:scaffold3792_cov87-Skeletonema_dohrnii-CCMP3373.AAC.1